MTSLPSAKPPNHPDLDQALRHLHRFKRHLKVAYFQGPAENFARSQKAAAEAAAATALLPPSAPLRSRDQALAAIAAQVSAVARRRALNPEDVLAIQMTVEATLDLDPAERLDAVEPGQRREFDGRMERLHKL